MLYYIRDFLSLIRLSARDPAFLPQPRFAGWIAVHAIPQPQKKCGLDSSIPQIWPICGTNCKFCGCGCGCRTRVHCNPARISSRIIFLENFTNEPTNEPITENVLLAGTMQNSRALLSTRIFSPKICGCGCSFACNQSYKPRRNKPHEKSVSRDFEILC